MAAEKINVRKVNTPQGAIKSIGAPLSRQTFVALPAQAAGQSAKTGASVAAILATNARQTHPYQNK